MKTKKEKEGHGSLILKACNRSSTAIFSPHFHRSVDMQLRSNIPLKSCKLLKKLHLQICGYLVGEHHLF
jgi:hypothetical protein